MTVFTTADLALLWGESNPELVKNRLYRYVKSGGLLRLRRGTYAKDANFDKYELATKIFSPSYVSFETVLRDAGVVFQYYGLVTVASYQTKEIDCSGQKYSFRKIKDDILTNPIGIENKGSCGIASPERAFLDTVYLQKEYHFDNLSALDWKKVDEILPIYGGGKTMLARVNRYRAASKD
jgi:hypothetical protein